MAIRSAPTSKAVLRLRMRVQIDEVVAIGPGRVELLEAVRDHGSISAAARSLDMSYRRAWLLLDALNGALGQPAIATAHGGKQGGGAEVTACGTALIALYRSIEHQALAATQSDVRRLLKLLRKA